MGDGVNGGDHACVGQGLYGTCQSSAQPKTAPKYSLYSYIF